MEAHIQGEEKKNPSIDRRNVKELVAIFHLDTAFQYSEDICTLHSQFLFPLVCASKLHGCGATLQETHNMTNSYLNL